MAGTSELEQCAICGKAVKRRGMKNHIRLAHEQRPKSFPKKKKPEAAPDAVSTDQDSPVAPAPARKPKPAPKEKPRDGQPGKSSTSEPSGDPSGQTSGGYDQGGAGRRYGLDEGAAAAQFALGHGIEAERAGPGADATQDESVELHWNAILQALFFQVNGFVRVRWPHWAGSTDELVSLSSTWGNVMEKYFPGASLGVEEAAGIATLAYVTPRLFIAASEDQQSRESEERRTAPAPQPTSAQDVPPSRNAEPVEVVPENAHEARPAFIIP